MAVIVLSHFIHFFYAPQGQPWYQGNVWGNVVAVSILGPLGWLWSKTRYWPLGLIHQKLDSLHEKHDAHSDSLDALHEKIDALHQKLDAQNSRDPQP